jgi:pimeloyl-ACP methyl ester carboxylesterase
MPLSPASGSSHGETFSIPYHDFGNGGEALHFAHANGYPPQAYAPLLDRLCLHHHVFAMRSRALWPASDPHVVQDWRIFADDLNDFLNQQGLRQGVLGVGHSIGATTTLRLALRQPDRFKALVLLDPVIFPLRTVLLWKLIFRLGLAYRLHPLVKGAMKRRNTFPSRQAMFDNYRRKPVFSRLSDASLNAYVDALACQQPDGSMLLCYPPEWEARIYVTSMRADVQLWRDLHTLRPPVLLIRGAETDTLWESTARRFQSLLPHAQVVTLPNTTHLLPLEAPDVIANQILEFFEHLQY